MDLNYSNEELAFRDEVRGWLAKNLPAELSDKVGDHERLSKEDIVRWHRILAKQGWIAPSWPKEWGGNDWNVVQRYIFEEECGYAGTPAADPLRPHDVRAGADPLRHAGAEVALPAAHLQRRRFLVPGLLGTRLGLGPGLAQDAGGALGRALRRQRAEDLDHARPLRRLDLLPGAHRAATTKKQDGISFLLIDMKTPGHHRAPAHAHGRRPRSERGVLRRREGAGGKPRSRRGRRLDRGQVPARPRAHEHRAHRHFAPRARAPAGIRLEADEERPPDDRGRALPRQAHAPRGRAHGAVDHQPALPRPVARRQAPGGGGLDAQDPRHRDPADAHRADDAGRRAPGAAVRGRGRGARTSTSSPRASRRATPTSARPRSTRDPTRSSATSSPR